MARQRKPAKLKVACLRGEAVVKVDGRDVRKPMLVGFAKAEELHAIARAPAFSERDSNQLLAEMLQKLPVRKWQRPLDHKRIIEMSGFFSSAGHLMPNPVLLAENPDLQGLINKTIHGELVTLELRVTPRAREEGALWILDGQHRINALAKSAQRSNPIPFVLLLDESGNYSKAEFADIFAQVTTKAVPLEEPHRTWLEYSFNLGGYEEPSGHSRRAAFETIVWLGSDEFAGQSRVKNRFAGNIRFNPQYPDKQSKVGVEGREGVFSFAAQEFGQLVYKHYYNKPPSSSLSPRELAAEIASSYAALRTVVPQPQKDAVFFNPGNLYVQEAFVVGVLTYLRVHGAPTRWADVLRAVKIDQGSWEFRGRQINTGGQHGRPSRAAAIGTFQHVFERMTLPTDSTSLVSFLLGDTGTGVTMTFEDAADSGTPVQISEISNQNRVPLDGMLKKGRILKIEASPNIGTLRITASSRAPAFWADMTKKVRARNGFALDALAKDLVSQGQNGAVTVTVWFELYGGEERSTQIIFT